MTWISSPSSPGRAGSQAQGRRNADGSPKLKGITETLSAAPKSKLLNTLGFGVGFGLVGGFVGVFGAILSGQGAVIPALAGGAAVVGAALGYASAAGDRVKLEWQDTPILEHNLVGYRHRVTEDTKTDSDGHTTTDDYEHRFTPLYQYRELGRFHKPVVVHYRD